MAFLHAVGSKGSQAKANLKARSLTPYLLLAPGLIWLVTFFIIPIFSLASTSTMVRPEGAQIGTYVQELRFANYIDAFMTIAYPLAYTIAFKSGKYRNILLVLVIAPFFTSFLLRTIAWTQILSDSGPVVSAIKILPFVDELFRINNTSAAVVIGLAYNFLPFMTLPLYASLERIDPRTLEAAGDLYSDGFTTFRKVTLPLSMPGVVAGTLLTFIPAAGDYVNAAILGNPSTKMIGNVIESRFFAVVDYPTAAALSFTLMATILILVTLYIRKSGTDELV
jgi:spermidine/putrescine transport system permease protein